MTTESEPAVQEPTRPAWWAGLWRQLAAFLTAVRFLTRVPVPERLFPQGEEPAALLRASVVYFPLVGSLIGVAMAMAIIAGRQLWNSWLAVVIGLAFEAMLTGAFHEDAVADFCDAFGGGWSREDILRILKDSRIGSFGALGLIFAVLLRAGGLISVQPEQLVPVAVASATLGRWVILLVMAMLPPVPDRASVARDVGARVTARELLLGSFFALPGVVAWSISSPYRFTAAIAVLLLFVVVFVWYVRRRLGGVTGDCLGCACYVGQVLTLLAATAGVRS
jgi:adenosylcobinamide-GDP ribazoletransferase